MAEGRVAIQTTNDVQTKNIPTLHLPPFWTSEPAQAQGVVTKIIESSSC